MLEKTRHIIVSKTGKRVDLFLQTDIPQPMLSDLLEAWAKQTKTCSALSFVIWCNKKAVTSICKVWRPTAAEKKDWI